MFTDKAGFAAVVANVNNNFGVKDYTQEMLDALKDPTANLALTIQAYQFFQAMKNGQDFVTPDGQKLSFANLPDSMKTSLTTVAMNIINLYQTINVPIDNKGDTTPLLKADGTPASLRDLASDPNGQYHVSFSNKSLDGTDRRGYHDNSPDWSKNSSGNDLYNTCYDKYSLFGGDSQFNCNGVAVDASQNACGGETITISGSIQDWVSSGALQFVSPPGTSANNQATCNAYENWAQQNM